MFLFRMAGSILSRLFFVLTFSIALFVFTAPSTQASDWSQETGYWNKTSGKFIYGAKNSLLGWTAMFTEPYKPRYQVRPARPWQGFYAGMARSVIYTASGLIQWVTFPVPIDFPNVGEGVGYPEQPKSYLQAQ